MSKEWKQFLVLLDQEEKAKLRKAFGDRIPEDWNMDMTRAVIANNGDGDRLSDAEYVRLYKRLGRGAKLTVTAFGTDGNCACALCRMEGSRRRILLPLAHDWGSRVWDSLSITDWQPLDRPVEVSGIVALRRPDGMGPEEVRSKVLRRVADWKNSLSVPVNVILDDGGSPVDGKVRDVLDRMPTKSGWFDRDEGTANVYVPNLVIHADTEKQLSIFDEKILGQTVGRYGLAALVGGREDAFLKKLGRVNAPKDAPEDETAMERATRFVHSVVRSLAAELRQGEDSASYSIGPVKGWMRVREALLAANPLIPGLKGGDTPVERTDRLLVNAIASYASKVRYNDAELHGVARDEQRAQYNAALARLVAKHDRLEARGQLMTKKDLDRGIRLGHPSNILLCATAALRDTDTIITGSAIYGKEDSQDKQIRHPYDVTESLSDLPDNLADPLAVYYHRDDSTSATVLLDREVDDADGHCTFVAALCYAKDINVNVVKTCFPKWDIDIILNLARSQENGRPLVSYVRPDFEQKWLRPACERIRTYYEETLPALYEGEEKDETYFREMDKYEAFKRNLPLAEKMIGHLARFSVPDDGKRFFRVQTASAELSGDLVGSLDAPIALAATESHRASLTEYKRSVVEQYVAGMATTPFSVCTAESLPALMKKDGVPDRDIASVSEALDEGLEINGFVHGGKVYVISDNMHSLEQVRNTYVHERQHILDTTVEKKRMDALARNVDADRAWHLLSCLTRDRDAYDGRTAGELLSEASAFAMELAYGCEPSEVEDMLRSKGVEDRDFIRFIKEKNDGQYKEDGLRKARYTSPFCDGYRVRSVGIQQKTLGAAVEGQGAGPAEEHKKGVEVTPIERLSAVQKRDGVRYPTWRELEAVAPSAAVLAAPRRDMSLSLRINRKTKPVISKWFDKWFKASYGTSFTPINDEKIEIPAPDLVEGAEGGFAEDLNDEARKETWKKTRDAYREQFLAYIDTLEGNALQLAASKWFCTGAVRLPEDLDKVEQALHLAEVNKADYNTFNSPMDVILRFAKKENTEYVSPYDYPQLSDEVIIDNGLHYFNIQDDFEGQMAARMILNGQPNPAFHTGNFSPWCLLTATEGHRVPTESARGYWKNKYNGMPKGIWMKEIIGADGNPVPDKDGRPMLEAVAFHADEPSMKNRDTNWGLDDFPYRDGKVPVVAYDADGNKSVVVYSAKNGRLLSEDRNRKASEPGLKEFVREHLGDRADEYLKDDALLNVKTAYDADDRIRAVQAGTPSDGKYPFDRGKGKAVAASFRYDAQGRRCLWTEQTLHNGAKSGPYRSFWPNGNPKMVCTYLDDRSDRPYQGDYVQYFEDGSVYKKGQYTSRGFPLGEHIENYPGGAPKKRFTYNDNAELAHAVTYSPDGLMMSETKDDTLTIFYPEKNPKTGEQLPSKVCRNPRFVNIDKKFKGIVAKELKTEYHPFADAEGNPVVKRLTHYREYIPYLQETFSPEGRVTAREWKQGRYSPTGNNRFLFTDDTMKQTVVELNEFDYGDAHSMRVVYNDDWSVREVTTRKHSDGMKPDGFHCLFPGDGTAVISEYHEGVYDAVAERKVSAKEGMAVCADNRFFRLCEFVRTAETEKVTGLFRRITDCKSDGQTPEDILVDDLKKEYKGRKKNDALSDLPYRIEGRDGVKGKRPASFESLLRWFMDLGEERQLEVFGAVGLELPNQYGMDSFPEVFCNAMTDSPAVVITPQQLAILYSIYDRDTGNDPGGLNNSLALNRELSLKRETTEEERKESGRMTLGDVRKMGAWMRDSMRGVIASAEHAPLALPFLMFRSDGSLLTADNALCAAAAGAGRKWAPDFFTRKELQAMGADVVRPDAKPVTVKNPTGEDGTVTVETLYNLADSTYPQQHPEEYAIYLKVREEQRTDLREWLDVCMPDPEELKDDLCNRILRERPAYKEYTGYLRNLVEVGVDSLSGQPMGMPFTVKEWPDEQTSYHMTRAVGKTIESAIEGELLQVKAPTFSYITGRIREAAREKNMAWAKDYSNNPGTGTGKGIH